jgi:hypothetical protein
MPSPSTRTSRSAARPGRSGRPGSSARFARSTQRPASRPLPPRFTPRGSKPKTKGKGSSSGLTGMLSVLPFGKSKAKPASSGRGKKGAGLALLTAAAGFAVSNRDKLGGLLHRDKAQQPEPVMPPPTAPPVDSAPPTP